MAQTTHVRSPQARGFTLVEVMVALGVLSLVAVLGWRGLDSMVRTQSQLQTRADAVLALQAGLSQWRADLDATLPLPGLPTIEWNGQVLRLVRRVDAVDGSAVSVVAWARRNDERGSLWRRWQSLPATTRQDIETAWLQADLWARNPGATERLRETPVTALDDWQLYFHRGGAWVNPQSNDARAATAESATPPPLPAQGPASAPTPTPTPTPAPADTGRNTSLPEGVRLILSLPTGGAAAGPIAGQVTLDWVNPRVSGGRP